MCPESLLTILWGPVLSLVPPTQNAERTTALTSFGVVLPVYFVLGTDFHVATYQVWM